MIPSSICRRAFWGAISPLTRRRGWLRSAGGWSRSERSKRATRFPLQAFSLTGRFPPARIFQQHCFSGFSGGVKGPRGDYRHRESKKSKKDAKKPTIESVLPTPVTVEVVKKGKRQQEESEEKER